MPFTKRTSIENSFKKIKNEKEYLNNFTLKFKNKKYQQEYEETTNSNRRKFNLILITFSLVVSIGLLTIMVVCQEATHKELKKKNVKLKRMDEVSLRVLESKGLDLKDTLFHHCYLVLNETKMKELYILSSDLKIDDSNFTNSANFSDPLRNTNFNPMLDPTLHVLNFSFNSDIYISNKNTEYYSFVLSFNFIRIAYKIAFLLFALASIVTFLILTNKTDKNQKILFSINLIIFGFNFHLISGISIVYMKFSPEFLFFIIVSQLLIQIVIVTKAKFSWTLISLSCFICILLEWSLLYFIHFKILNAILYYLSVNTIAKISCSVLSYCNEINLKKEFYLLKNLIYEKKYLMNFLYNMNQGFLTFKRNEDVIFINKVMSKIINDDTLEIENEKNNNADQNTGNISTRNSVKNTKEDVDSEDLTNKIKIETILHNLSEINLDLPENLHKWLKNNKISIEELFDLIENKHNKKFSNFTNLGIVNLASKKYQINFRIISHEENDHDVYLEVLFTDVTEIVQAEREKAVANSRSIYLSKIAHEFQNPLTSLMELSSCIKEEVKGINSYNNNTIFNLVDYSERIYNIMTHFLKDFQIFTNLKYPCRETCEQLLICPICKFKDLCRKCNNCKKCAENKKIYVDYLHLIDYNIENFNSLAKFELRNYNIFYRDINNAIHSNHLNMKTTADNLNTKIAIKTNSELLSSSLYNLINHTYKSSNAKKKNEVLIRTKQIKNEDPVVKVVKSSNSFKSLNSFKFKSLNDLNENNVDWQLKSKIKNNIKIKNDTIETLDKLDTETVTTFFEIIEDRRDLDLNFINKLTNFGDANTDYNVKNEELKTDKFNKYFNLYVAFFIIKKLGSELKIESDKNFTKYSFKIISKIKLIEISNSNSNLITNVKMNLQSLPILPRNLPSLLSEPCVPIVTILPTIPIPIPLIAKQFIKTKDSKFQDYANTDNIYLQNLDNNIQFKFISSTNDLSAHVTSKNILEASTKNYAQSIVNIKISSQNLLKNNSSLNKNSPNVSPINKPLSNYYRSKFIPLSQNSSKNILANNINLTANNNVSEIINKPPQKAFLIIDDELLIRNIIKRFLKKINNDYYIEEASNCFEALNILYKKNLENFHFNVLIVDEYMPNMKGSTLIKLLKQLFSENNFYNMKIISHTAFDDEEKKKFILNCGADFVLNKPVNFPRFNEFLKNIIE